MILNTKCLGKMAYYELPYGNRDGLIIPMDELNILAVDGNESECFSSIPRDFIVI